MNAGNNPYLRNQKPDLEAALFLAGVCGQAYVQFNNKEDGLFLVPRTYALTGEITASPYDSRPERFGFVIQSEKCAVMAFRGTGSAVDWVSDFIAQQTLYRPVRNAGQTHKGFTDIYMSARDNIFNLLGQLPADLPLFITGHSLGGSLATLAALDIAHNSPFRSPIVYTYGAPRVGDPKFVQTYNYCVPTHWRFQNEHDIVPHLPPLVYQSPRTKQTYFYLHVKGEVPRSFRMGSVSGNHILDSYFTDLAKEQPLVTASMCAEPPGWCPEAERKEAAVPKANL